MTECVRSFVVCSFRAQSLNQGSESRGLTNSAGRFAFTDLFVVMTCFSPLFRFLSLLLLAGATIAGPDARAQHVRTVSRTIDLQPDGKVELSAVAGSVRVATWDRPGVEMSLRMDGNSAAQVDDIRVQVEGDDSHVKIRTNNADPDGVGFLDLIGLGSTEGPTTNYTLRVPTTASLRVTTKSGAVEVVGLEGDVTVEGMSASVHVRDIGGRVISGTFSGPLRAENVRGELIFGTFSGDLFLRAASLPAKSQIGSFSGNAEVVLPADAAFNLRTDVSWGGKVTSDFAMPDSSAEGSGPIPIGGGGPTIAFESFSGDLTLRAE